MKLNSFIGINTALPFYLSRSVKVDNMEVSGVASRCNHVVHTGAVVPSCETELAAIHVVATEL
eukprot:COSAG02_NODE_1140_length_14275_cov_154.904557_7_plen_63_part_00